MSNKIYRTVSITMEATATNFNKLRVALLDCKDCKGWEFSDHLSKNPEPGETWRSGFGEDILIHDSPNVDGDHPLCNVANVPACGDSSDRYISWRKNGWWHNDMWNCQNLVERVKEVAVIEIKDGEYWMDREGNVHHVTVTDNIIYCVETTAEYGPHYTWMRNGSYNEGIPNHRKDLVKKMVPADDCTK